MAGLSELFTSVSGWLKLSELVLIFITLIIHRHGDNGHYLYFSTTGTKLGYDDPNIDAENLGNGTLVTFLIITIVLIIGYVIDGREYIQQSILEPIWNLLGAFMFMGSGSMAIITWKDEQALKTSSSTSLTEMEYHRNISSAMAMGAMCIIIGLIYLIDLGVSWYNRGKITQDEGP
eukprot:TRINITY_DN60520_c0_g1_i1.p1 TRINITY_DN60520_c0_g1~~TRINITY_DN60520_c0_g1_i1.p1  ORF type:complete len:176 (-),score=19.48 TRINITY_DN60520_c0_g1_i1:167-694(-)